MNWEAIGAIGEVGGTIAVVATLFLLYRQIKQSSVVAKVQIDTMAKDQFARLTLQPVVTPDLARIIEVGHSQDPSPLSPDEVRSVFWWFTSYGTILEGMFIRWKQHQLAAPNSWDPYKLERPGRRRAPRGHHSESNIG
jgi:nitrate reductase gamma subunit